MNNKISRAAKIFNIFDKEVYSNKELPYSDNYRFAEVGNEMYKCLYGKALNNGCCGFLIKNII